MKAFFYGVMIQWKLDLRNKGVFITYYLVPLLFFCFIGAIFTSINPASKDTLIQSMTIFAFTMGAFLGTPIPLVELYSSEIKKANKVGGIPLWVGAVNNLISAFVHLFITAILIYFIAPLAFDARLPENTMVYFLSMAVFLLVCIMIGTVLGLYVKNSAKLTMYSQLIFLPSLMLSGIMFPVELLPKALATAGYVFPATWGLKLMAGAEFEILNLVPLLGFLILAAVISGYKITKLAVD